ncbi:dCTP deaminase [Aliarcobacter butzleri]
MSVISKDKLIDLIKSKKLVITPILSKDETFDNVSLNVRLSNQFIIMKKQSFPSFDIKSHPKNIEECHKKIKINYNESFILHPGELVLGSTLEYFSIPKNLMGYVIGKSSWGRAGLIVATATKVDPGFKGCITLEIINEGASPIIVYPGLPIAQLVLHDIQPSIIEEYSGEYKFSAGPVFPNFEEKSKKWDFWFPKEI